MHNPMLFPITLEVVLNAVLALDDTASQRMRPLSGKTITLCLTEFPQAYTLTFTSKIEVTAGSDTYDPNLEDCRLQLSMFTVQALQDNSNIMQLIKQDKLQIEGDIGVAQQLAGLFKELDIDWEEHISKYTGDVAAHCVYNLAKELRTTIERSGRRARQIVKDAAIEEKHITPHQLQLDEFVNGVHSVRTRVDHLQVRIEQLRSARSKPPKKD